VLLVLLVGRLGDFGVGRLLRYLGRMLPAIALMAIVVVQLLGLIDWTVPGPFWMRLGVLAGAVCSGALAYAFGCWLFGVDEIRQGGRYLRDRFLRGRTAGGPRR